MKRKIIDFHTHPFLTDAHNFCFFQNHLPMVPDGAVQYLKDLGITHICGSVLERTSSWEQLKACNREALALSQRWGDFYVPGFHIHPEYMQESLSEIKLMANEHVKLVGELVPYMHGWDLSHPNIPALLGAMEQEGMILSFHSTNISDDILFPLLEQFPDLTFVAAHPGEKASVDTHLHRMERYSNYYLDLSGSGLGRIGVLRYMLDRIGKERFLFGTDFPICPPPMYISTINQDPTLTEEEKNAVFYENAQRLLGGNI